MHNLLKFTIHLGLILFFLSCSKDSIEVIKNGELPEYPGVKIGPTIEAFMGPCHWEQIKTDDNVFEHVNIIGHVIHKEKQVEIILQVRVIDNFFSFDEALIDGEKQGSDNLSTLLNIIFENNLAVNSKQTEKNGTSEKQKIETKQYPMILVEGGTFKMGSNEGEDDEKPEHEVTLSDFYIGKYEVTRYDFYIAQVDHNKRLFQKIKELENTNFDEAKRLTNEFVKYDRNGDLIAIEVPIPDYPSLPVEYITWYAAVDYCNWLSDKEGIEKCYTINGKKVICDFTAKGYRLPTEAEWEFAAKGGNKSEGYKYSGGSNYLKVAWMRENSDSKVHLVGTREPNELGIFDMTGNVWEWCWDLYDRNYYKNSPSSNPTGPTTGSARVTRGGGWNNSASNIRVINRCYANPYNSRDYTYVYGHEVQDILGFRLAKTK